MVVNISRPFRIFIFLLDIGLLGLDIKLICYF